MVTLFSLQTVQIRIRWGQTSFDPSRRLAPAHQLACRCGISISTRRSERPWHKGLRRLTAIAGRQPTCSFGSNVGSTRRKTRCPALASAAASFNPRAGCPAAPTHANCSRAPDVDGTMPNRVTASQTWRSRSRAGNAAYAGRGRRRRQRLVRRGRPSLVRRSSAHWRAGHKLVATAAAARRTRLVFALHAARCERTTCTWPTP